MSVIPTISSMVATFAGDEGCPSSPAIQQLIAQGNQLCDDFRLDVVAIAGDTPDPSSIVHRSSFRNLAILAWVSRELMEDERKQFEDAKPVLELEIFQIIVVEGRKGGSERALGGHFSSPCARSIRADRRFGDRLLARAPDGQENGGEAAKAVAFTVPGFSSWMAHGARCRHGPLDLHRRTLVLSERSTVEYLTVFMHGTHHTPKGEVNVCPSLERWWAGIWSSLEGEINISPGPGEIPAVEEIPEQAKVMLVGFRDTSHVTGEIAHFLPETSEQSLSSLEAYATLHRVSSQLWIIYRSYKHGL